MAANRAFRLRAQLWRVRSRSSRNASTVSALMLSVRRSSGLRPRFLSRKAKSSLNVSLYAATVQSLSRRWLIK